MSETTQNYETNGKAIATLIFGILSLMTIIFSGIGMIFGIVGLIIGVFGLREIKIREQHGRKVAIAGIICSAISILLVILLFIGSVFVFINIESSLSLIFG